LIPAAAVGAISVASAVSSVNAAASKYIEDKQAIELSDMSFMWKALEHTE
jgi:hypothetical protein